jgi:hypothetical protein
MRIRAYLVACLVVAASILTATPALADDGDEDYILGPFSPWSAPENLGPPVNTRYNLFALFVCEILSLASAHTRPFSGSCTHWPHRTQVAISAILQAFLDLVERNPGLPDGVGVDIDQRVRLVLPVPITARLPQAVPVPVCELPHSRFLPSLILLGIHYLSLLSWRAARDIPAPLSVVLVSSGPGRHHLSSCARLPSPRRPCRATSP